MQKNKSKTMKYLLGILCSVVLFAACSDDEKDKAEELDKRTVIVYVSAENNLHTFIESDLAEMTEGSKSIPEKMNLVAFVDNADKNTLPYIINIKNGERIIDTDYSITEDFYASDPAKMHETISWIMKKYPSESYGLVLWGHASGWLITNDTISYNNQKKVMKRAYGGDNGNNSYYGSGKIWMNIPSMADMLERLPMKLDFIMADCCNFMGTETAYELRNATDYIIGSPAEIPGNGAPYDKVVPKLFNLGNDFYKGIVDEYYNGYVDNVVLSVVKTSAMEELAKATKNVMPELLDEEIDTEGLIYYYGGNMKIMFDAKGLMKQNISQESYANWQMALDKAVVYKKMSSKWDTMGYVNFNEFKVSEDIFGGLNMFVPLDMYDRYGYTHNSDIQKMEWYYATGMNK